jgi:hypothetical protein
MAQASGSEFSALLGQVVVLDMSSPFVFVGRLVDRHGDYFVLDDADSHDLRDGQATREKYVLDCRRLGVNPNRKRVWVNHRDLVSISRLDDVHEF